MILTNINSIHFGLGYYNISTENLDINYNVNELLNQKKTR